MSPDFLQKYIKIMDDYLKVPLYFIGTLPLSQMVETTLSAESIIKDLVEYFERMKVPISNSCFSCMDTTNVNSGEKKILKHLLQHQVPRLVWKCG